MFSHLLLEGDARRATEVVEVLLAHGLRCALTGGLAIAAQLRVHGCPVERKHLNDIDLVVDGFEAIPASLAAVFLLNHVHSDALEGKTLVQLIDATRAVRVDLFRAFGHTLRRAAVLDDETGDLPVLSVEDLAARTTAHVCGSLRRGRNVDLKHATAFTCLDGLGRDAQLADAWSDHHQEVPGTLNEATQEATRLLGAHPGLAVTEEYSTEIVPCEKCCATGPFAPAPAEKIVQILGYW